MKFIKALKQDLRKNTSSTYLKVALFAVTLIPLLYGALYLKAFWDPYAKMDKIPVAVINLDAGFNNGVEKNIGNDLVTKLKTNTNLDWDFVSEKQASDGLSSKKYYASITIPKDFSSKIYSVDGNSPQKATIVYKSRESTNYLATTITSRVSSEVANNLSSEVISKYFNNIFVSVKNTAIDLQKATDGASQLQSGLATAVSGSGQLKLGLSDATNGNKLITDGLYGINTNQNKLTTGLADAVIATNSLKNGASDIAAAQTQLKTGLDSLSSGLTGVESATSVSQAGVAQAQSIIESYVAAHPEAASELAPAAQTLVASINGLSQVNSGIIQINTKTKEAAIAVNSINNSQSKIVTGLSTMGQSLKIAESGSSQLADGSTKLIAGATKINTGLSSLNFGASSLQAGLITAEDGTIQLRDKLSLGATKAAESSEDKKVVNGTNIMSDPITVKDNSYDLVSNYGSSLTPYFVSLALWVGGLMTFFVIDFEKKPKNKTAVATKYFMLCAVGIVQSVVLDTVLVCGLGLKVSNLWQFYGFTMLISLSFMALLQLFIHNFGNIGRYIAIILLVLQLTSAAGTFPKETLPLFFQIINPLLPMTYSISGIRDLVFTNELSNLVGPVLYLLGVIVVSLSINFILAHHKTSKLSKRVI